MNLDLNGKRALVTGASKGIGAVTARLLAAEGCDVVIVSRSREELQMMADQIADVTSRSVVACPADLSRSSEVARVAEQYGDVDILVNNAGAIPGGRLEDIDEGTWRAAWDLKVFGYINLTREIFKQMSARRSGTIVNVIGAAAQIRDPSYICGVAGNAALTAFTMSLGSDSHRVGVRVVGVSPGPVATQRLLGLQDSVQSSSARPFGRAAEPLEVASAVAFLASPRSGYTSGTVLMVDGGLSARAVA
ncbi:MAG TPA: short-chain dehydrogenase/reductase [Paraburkholderia sp.]|uniref:short-chain dehydrogenase/reductase n=1 Tax=Paraburkholderia sp. TaxID=1926495 RepID=UPI002B47F4B5|nr:short-chain dehydrogenase/reductase [Paraburkholderia sp.]HKR42494.1 short-chain dehydrogenase/reductase [Paraburkholderia sp.]